MLKALFLSHFKKLLTMVNKYKQISFVNKFTICFLLTIVIFMPITFIKIQQTKLVYFNCILDYIFIQHKQEIVLIFYLNL